ncbi:MAG TPA: MarR family transcriptional regulator [Candidatus Methylacidiphilales bacterium]|nr:MarR family transcriptional regulator [Candidatus Methylacidiphilales bacterium]
MNQFLSPNVRQIFGSRLGNTARRWRRAVDELLAPFGLTEATWLPLLYVSRGGTPMRQKDLAEVIGIESSTLVRLIDALDHAGLIERQTDEDRRAKLICLTPRGRAVVKRVEAATVTIRKRTLADISDEDLAITVNVLDRVRAALARAGQLEPVEEA